MSLSSMRCNVLPPAFPLAEKTTLALPLALSSVPVTDTLSSRVLASTLTPLELRTRTWLVSVMSCNSQNPRPTSFNLPVMVTETPAGMVIVVIVAEQRQREFVQPPVVNEQLMEPVIPPPNEMDGTAFQAGDGGCVPIPLIPPYG